MQKIFLRRQHDNINVHKKTGSFLRMKSTIK